jgi:hypothetical protein
VASPHIATGRRRRTRLLRQPDPRRRARSRTSPMSMRSAQRSLAGSYRVAPAGGERPSRRCLHTCAQLCASKCGAESDGGGTRTSRCQEAVGSRAALCVRMPAVAIQPSRALG